MIVFSFFLNILLCLKACLPFLLYLAVIALAPSLIGFYLSRLLRSKKIAHISNLADRLHPPLSRSCCSCSVIFACNSCWYFLIIARCSPLYIHLLLLQDPCGLLPVFFLMAYKLHHDIALLCCCRRHHFFHPIHYLNSCCFVNNCQYQDIHSYSISLVHHWNLIVASW